MAAGKAVAREMGHLVTYLANDVPAFFIPVSSPTSKRKTTSTRRRHKSKGKGKEKAKAESKSTRKKKKKSTSPPGPSLPGQFPASPRPKKLSPSAYFPRVPRNSLSGEFQVTAAREYLGELVLNSYIPTVTFIRNAAHLAQSRPYDAKLQAETIVNLKSAIDSLEKMKSKFKMLEGVAKRNLPWAQKPRSHSGKFGLESEFEEPGESDDLIFHFLQTAAKYVKEVDTIVFEAKEGIKAANSRIDTKLATDFHNVNMNIASGLVPPFYQPYLEVPAGNMPPRIERVPEQELKARRTQLVRTKFRAGQGGK